MNGSTELGVITIDRAANIQSWNDWLVSATGVPEGEVSGRPLLSLVTPERQDVIRAFLDEVLSTGTTRVLAPAFHRYLIGCRPLQWSRHFAEMQQFVTIAPLMAAGAISGAMVTVEDVTPQLDRQRDLMLTLDAAPRGQTIAGALESVGAGDWQLRSAAVRNLRQRASTAEIAHLLDTLRRGYQDLNVVSSALQVLSANRDVITPLIELLSDPQRDLRMHAALALGNLRDAVAVPALINALDDDEPNVRFHAIEALGTIGAGDAVERLADIARSGDFFVAFPAIDALAKANDPRVGPALASLLDDDHLRPAVIDALAAVGDEEAVAPLVHVLNGAVGDSAAAVAAALDGIRAREDDSFGDGGHIVDLARRAFTPAGIAALAAGVAQKRQPFAPLVSVLGWSGVAGLGALVRAVGSPAVETVVADALLSIGRDAVEPLLTMLREGERDARLAAAPLLGAIGDRRAVAPLIAVLGSADAELTAAAAGALASLGDAASLDPLLALFAHEQAIVRQAAIAAINSIGAAGTAARIKVRLEAPEAHVRTSAVRVAGYFGFDDCVAGVLRALSDTDQDVRRAAIEQLPVIDDPRALPLLVEALAQEVPRNRAAAAHALRLVQGPAVAAPLVDALDDDDAWVRYFAAGALAERRDAEAVPALSRLAHADPAPHVRIAALQALASIDPFVSGEISVPLVHDPDQEVASAALTAVAAGSHPSADELLEEAVKSSDVVRRRAAVVALPARSTANAAELLAWAARLQDPPDLPRLAIASLHRIAATDNEAARRAAVAGLLGLASTSETRDAALRALATLPEDVVDQLRASLQAPRAATRLAVVETLARLRHPRASDALAPALYDEDAAIRRAAVAGFGRLGTRKVASAISVLSTSDPDPDVRRIAGVVCRRHHWPCGGAA